MNSLEERAMPQQNPTQFADESQRQLYEEQLRLRAEVERLRAEQERLKSQRRDGAPKEEAGHSGGAPSDAPPTVAPVEHDDPVAAEPKRRGVLRRNPVGVLIAGILLVAAIVAFYFLWGYWSSYESTDDAQIGAHMDPVSSRISGTVIGVYADDNQRVEAGKLLVKI